jgi:hypothetical protein
VSTGIVKHLERFDRIESSDEDARNKVQETKKSQEPIFKRRNFSL